MRILHLAPRLSERGGADLCLLGLLEAQRERHDVTLAVGRVDATAPEIPGVVRLAGLAARARASVRLEALLERVKPDVLHVHHVVNPDVLEQAARRGALVTIQDHRVFCPGQGKWTRDGRVCRERMSAQACAGCFEEEPYFREMLALTRERLQALQGARVHVLSDYMKQELVAAGLAPDQVTAVPPLVHGLDLSARPDGPPCVLFVGRLVRAKGPFDAAEAWRRSGVALPLVFAGTGSSRPHLERAGHEVLGWLPRSRLSATYARARALVLPSRWQEPFGLVGLEALSFGVPVVAWESGGVAEWHPGQGLVPWGNVDALAEALAAAVDRRAAPPPGYAAPRLVERLEGLYGREGGPAPRTWGGS